MENMLDRIIEMDDRAKKITEQATNDKVDAMNKIAELSGERRKELLKKAQKKIEETIVTEKEKNKKNIKMAREEFENKTKELQDKFEKQKDKWVKDVFNRVLEA